MFSVSNVSGLGIDLLKAFMNRVRRSPDRYEIAPVALTSSASSSECIKESKSASAPALGTSFSFTPPNTLFAIDGVYEVQYLLILDTVTSPTA